MRQTLFCNARRPRIPRSAALTVVAVLMLCTLAGCRPPAPAERVVEPPASFSRPVATLGPDDAAPSRSDPAATTAGATGVGAATPAARSGCVSGSTSASTPAARRCASTPRQ